MAKNKTEELQNMVKGKEKKIDGNEIENLVEEKVKELLLCDPNEIEKDIFYMRATQTKIGMTYSRDRAIMKRVSSGQMIRMINFITTDPSEKKAYLSATIPEFSVVSQIEGV